MLFILDTKVKSQVVNPLIMEGSDAPMFVPIQA